LMVLSQCEALRLGNRFLQLGGELVEAHGHDPVLIPAS
jgi:hypothetical protein